MEGFLVVAAFVGETDTFLMIALFGKGLKHFGHGLCSSPGGRVHLNPQVGHSIL